MSKKLRHVMVFLAGSAAIAVALTARHGAHAANTITVNTVIDQATPGDKQCSLREAINNANSPGTDTTGGDCAVGTGNDTVVFSVSGEIDLVGVLATIANTLTIDGTSHAITINAGGNSQVFVINPGTLVLNNLTIEGGFGDLGGAISVGGGGVLTVQNSTLADNFATSAGGAIYNNVGTLKLIADTFFENVAVNLNSQGGAIENVSGVVAVSNSTFYENFAGSGAAIYNCANQLLVVGNSTFVSNQGSGTCGTLFNQIGPPANGVLKVFGSIVANGGAGQDCADFGCSGDTWPVTDSGYNIADDDTCGFSGTGANGQTIGDGQRIFLGMPSLENNGGPTRTVALQPGSPAIDAIPIGQCPATDQRGFLRTGLGDIGTPACDIGAFESGAASPTPTATPRPTATPTARKTPTRTPTKTPSRTPTRTPTHTHTPTVTPARTPIRTPAPTRTPTRTPSHTPTRTPSHTPTRTPSRTPTRTPSHTPKPTPTP